MKQNNIKYLIPEGVSIGIYKITAPDGHYYIGSANNFKKRLKSHIYKLETNTHENNVLQNKYNAHPDWLWKYELVEQVNNVKDVKVFEQKHLDLHFGSKLCINLNPNANKPPSWKGKKQSQESNEKRRRKLKGRVITDEWRRNISIAQKNPVNLMKRRKKCFIIRLINCKN
jgi:hypothetical protein